MVTTGFINEYPTITGGIYYRVFCPHLRQPGLFQVVPVTLDVVSSHHITTNAQVILKDIAVFGKVLKECTNLAMD